jgi:putative nucleotidyltransferase with HDIG domain
LYQTRSLRRGDPRLAAALRSQARELATDALRRVTAPNRTVAGELLVARFVDRFAASLEVADWTVLLRWIDGSCRRYAGILAVAELLIAVAGAVRETLASLAGGEVDAREIDLVHTEIERLTSIPRLVREPALHEAIDEIDVALDDLVARLDDSDPLTAEHSRAVSAWCARLGRRLALAKHDIVHVSRCGLVHDIGKVSTPSEILNAPRRLTDEEMDVMRRHAEDGAKIVAALPLISHITPAVRNHHERFDGRGYPDGLAGGAIPSFARIVAVADAFNAMIGRRPYRPPFAPSIALERLVENRGTQFDPIVVDAMIDVVTNRG